MTILTLKGLFPCYHGDVTQLVNSRYCVLILCVLAISHVTMVSLYFRSSIQCFCPDHMTSIQCDMITSYCATPSLSETSLIKTDQVERWKTTADGGRVRIGFVYQLASLVLLLQATMFYAPYVISRELYRAFGIQPDELALSALEARRSRDPDDREAAIRDIATHVNVFCARKLHQRHASYGFRWLYTIRLSLAQILTRICYVANAIGQFYLLDVLLGIGFHSIGWSIVGRTKAAEVELPSLHEFIVKLIQNTDAAVDGLSDSVQKVLSGNDTEEILNALSNLSVNREQIEPYVGGLEAELEEDEGSAPPLFPLEVFCSFVTWNIGPLERYRLHCILPLNHLNQILFTYVWFLLFAAALVSCVSLAGSIVRLLLFPCGRISIRDRLQDLGLLDDVKFDEISEKIELFEKEFLGVDGTLLLSYVHAGSGDVIADGTLAELWSMYVERADKYSELAKTRKTKESVIEDVIKVPTHRHPPRAPDQPLSSVYDPMQPPEVPPSHAFDSAATYSRETAFSKPFDLSDPPDYSSTQRTDFDKLGLDDDFMV